ncbi:MAG: T9SS type A sorting domain-containing protein [Ignavibacteria bacterium]|nr:T9SS type A sorting domain-containing protein [Ignavibacteria bacterium]
MVDVDYLPQNYDLFQNYPNPFNPVTTISYQIPENNHVTLKVFDMIGNEVETLINEEKPAGYHTITFDAENISTGVYFYQLKVGDFVSTKKLILMK